MNHPIVRTGCGRRGVYCLMTSIAILASDATASAQAINLGHAVEIRIENSTNHDSGEPVGQSKLVLNTLLDTNSPGPFVVTLEQSRRVLATGSCAAEAVVYSGEAQAGQGYLRECATNYIPSASLRTNEPADVVIALVDDATDERTELYRGTFPVIAFNEWKHNDGDRAIHVEQRALRLDSFYGVGFVRQYVGTELEFVYVDARNTAEIPNESAMRCRVGAGEWRVFEGSANVASAQTARNRVWLDGTVHEDGPETIVTQFVRYSARMPITIAGTSARPQAGTSMDGAWTCELRFGGSGTRVVAREFRFDVRNGAIQPHALESQLAPGRGTRIVSVGINPDQMPVIFDPAIVRDFAAGRRLTGATSPLVSTMPARATNPSFTMPRGAPAAAPRGRRR